MRKMKWGTIVMILLITNLPIFLTTQVKSIEPRENQREDWYYDNLDKNSRRKIRQAMDYCIPRQQIIDGLYQGLAVPLATEVGQNVMGYDDSVQPRSYNKTRARALMAEVFGRSYNPCYGPNYFSMTLVSPTTNIVQTQFALMIAFAFTDIGIDVELKRWDWNMIMPRIYLDPVEVGYNYDHGGVDAWFSDKRVSPDPDYTSGYFKSNFAPAGDNAFWLENQEVTYILTSSIQDPDLSDRLEALGDFQKWFYDEVPKSIICQGLDVFAMDEELDGFDTYLVGRGWCFNNWTIRNPTSMNYTIPGDFIYLNPILTNNYYDYVALRNIFGVLTQRRGAYNLTHPVPQIAESWTQNADGTVWEVKIRPDIQFSDGTNLTVEDVLFTYHSIFEDTLVSPFKGFLKSRFNHGKSDIYQKMGTADTIVFELGTIYPYVESQIFNIPIIQKTQWENINYSDWQTHLLNTGTADEYPIGCGPYMMTDCNLTLALTQNVKLEVNPYFDPTLFGHDPEAAGGGIFFGEGTLEEIHVVVVKEATTAIAGLASGTYDVLDSQTGVQAQYDDLNAPNNEYNSKCMTALEYGWQELNYNHYDPRWGMNPHDPWELYPSFYEEGLADPPGPLSTALGLLVVVLTTIGIWLMITKVSWRMKDGAA